MTIMFSNGGFRSMTESKRRKKLIEMESLKGGETGSGARTKRHARAT